MSNDNSQPPYGKGGSPLPTANVSFRLGESTDKFTEEEVKGLLINPLNAGIGPFPRLVPDEQWIRAATLIIERDGPEQFLVNLLYVLREAFEVADFDQ